MCVWRACCWCGWLLAQRVCGEPARGRQHEWRRTHRCRVTNRWRGMTNLQLLRALDVATGCLRRRPLLDNHKVGRAISAAAGCWRAAGRGCGPLPVPLPVAAAPAPAAPAIAPVPGAARLGARRAAVLRRIAAVQPLLPAAVGHGACCRTALTTTSTAGCCARHDRGALRLRTHSQSDSRRPLLLAALRRACVRRVGRRDVCASGACGCCRTGPAALMPSCCCRWCDAASTPAAASPVLQRSSHWRHGRGVSVWWPHVLKRCGIV
jgi:hypothetical protein